MKFKEINRSKRFPTTISPLRKAKSAMRTQRATRGQTSTLSSSSASSTQKKQRRRSSNGYSSQFVESEEAKIRARKKAQMRLAGSNAEKVTENKGLYSFHGQVKTRITFVGLIVGDDGPHECKAGSHHKFYHTLQVRDESCYFTDRHNRRTKPRATIHLTLFYNDPARHHIKGRSPNCKLAFRGRLVAVEEASINKFQMDNDDEGNGMESPVCLNAFPDEKNVTFLDMNQLEKGRPEKVRVSQATIERAWNLIFFYNDVALAGNSSNNSNSSGGSSSYSDGRNTPYSPSPPSYQDPTWDGGSDTEIDTDLE